MKRSEVLEFIVVPPYHKRDQVAACEKGFSDFLTRRFRGYTFRIAGIAPLGGPDEEDFHILPVMSFVDDEGKMRMCDEPQSWLMSEIAMACKDFDFGRARH